MQSLGSVRRSLRLIAALTFMGGSADAYTRSTIMQQGFSPDGRYHLLITFITDSQDDSSLSSTVQITDVRRNTVVYHKSAAFYPEYRRGRSSVAELSRLLAILNTSERAVLAQYGLKKSVQGERLFNVTLNANDTRQFEASAQKTPFGFLNLTSLPPKLGCPTRQNRAEVRGFVLKLGSRVLQRDARLPASRQCALGYDLETAWRYKNSLAVVVRVFSEGYDEGWNVVPLVITAQLK